MQNSTSSIFSVIKCIENRDSFFFLKKKHSFLESKVYDGFVNPDFFCKRIKKNTYQSIYFLPVDNVRVHV